MMSKTEKTQKKGKKPNKSRTKKRISNFINSKNPNLTIHIVGLNLFVDGNPERYEESELNELKRIANHLSKSIWIDKTYVKFPGNRFKDAFIKENGWNGWNGLMQLLATSDFGRSNKIARETISESIAILAVTYMTDLLGKYGYDQDNISIGLSNESDFSVEYYEDTRTEWRS